MIVTQPPQQCSIDDEAATRLQLALLAGIQQQQQNEHQHHIRIRKVCHIFEGKSRGKTNNYDPLLPQIGVMWNDSVHVGG
jgi:hypothetical protein